MFTTEQKALIKAYIDSTPALAQLEAQNYDRCFDIAIELNKTAAPDFWLWNSQANVDDVFDAINWANFTPNWTIANNETAVQLQAKIAWNGIINIQQMNLQNMLIRMERINATKANIRQGLADALSGLPTGNINVNTPTSRNAGSVAVLNALRRKGSILEKILTTTDPVPTTTVSAYVPGFDTLLSGTIQVNHVYEIRNG